MTVAFVTFIASQASGAAASERAGVSTSPAPERASARSETACPSARGAVKFYERRLAQHRLRMGIDDGGGPRQFAPGHCPRYLAYVLQRKARAWRLRAEAWVEKHTLRDFEVRDGNHAWLKAVDEVQKVFPGTGPWLRSCSHPRSEGGWGRWVTYRDAYSAEYAAANYIVGGWLQFKLPTFKGFYRRGADYAFSLGFRIPRKLRQASDIQAWQSPLAQALAGGWAATNDQKGHWVGSGC